jgi:hypothetical protein
VDFINFTRADGAEKEQAVDNRAEMYPGSNFCFILWDRNLNQQSLVTRSAQAHPSAGLLNDLACLWKAYNGADKHHPSASSEQALHPGIWLARVWRF